MNLRTRRAAVATALGTVAVLAMSACSNAGTTTGEHPELSDGPVTLRFSWWGNDERGKNTQAAIDAFEAEHPNITIEGEYTDFGTYWDKLATQVASGDMPDVLAMQDSYLSTYVDNGTLYDLSSIPDLVGTGDFPAPALQTGVVDDKLYGLVISVAAESVMANPALFEQAGIPLPDDSDWTWDDYAELGAKLSAASGGAFYGIDSQALEPVHLEGWAREHGETIFDQDGNVSISPETIASFWEYQLKLQDSGATLPASELIEAWNGGQSANPMVTRKAAMGIVGYNWVEKVRSGTGDDIVILKPPSSPDAPEKRLFYRSGLYWSIAANTEHPAEAALFVDWLANSGESYDYLGTDRGLPVSTEVIDYLKPSMSASDLAQIDYADEVADIVGDPYVVPPPGAGAINALFQRYGEQVLLGQSKPADAAKSFIADLQQALADAK